MRTKSPFPEQTAKAWSLLLFLYFVNFPLIPPICFHLCQVEEKLALPGIKWTCGNRLPPFFLYKYYLHVNIKTLPQPENETASMIGSMCEKGTSLSQLSFTEVVISFSTWQAERKKIGKEDLCICCTVSQTYGERRGAAASVFPAVLHVIQHRHQWEGGSQQGANVADILVTPAEA